MPRLAKPIIMAARKKAVTQWVPGQSGNPAGRPPDVRTVAMLKNDLELAVRQQLTTTRITQVINRMIDIAIDKRSEAKDAVAAGKVVLGMAISKPHVQEQQSGKAGFTIVIENATLQAIQEKTQPVIDAQFTESKENDNE